MYSGYLKPDKVSNIQKIRKKKFRTSSKCINKMKKKKKQNKSKHNITKHIVLMRCLHSKRKHSLEANHIQETIQNTLNVTRLYLFPFFHIGKTKIFFFDFVRYFITSFSSNVRCPSKWREEVENKKEEKIDRQSII